MECVGAGVDGREAFVASRGLYETNTRSPWLVIRWLIVTLSELSKGKIYPPQAKVFQISPSKC